MKRAPANSAAETTDGSSLCPSERVKAADGEDVPSVLLLLCVLMCACAGSAARAAGAERRGFHRALI